MGLGAARTASQSRFGSRRGPTPEEKAQHEIYLRKQEEKAARRKLEVHAAHLGIATPNISAAKRLSWSHKHILSVIKGRSGPKWTRSQLESAWARNKALVGSGLKETHTVETEDGIYTVTTIRTAKRDKAGNPIIASSAGLYDSTTKESGRVLTHPWTPQEKIDYKVNRIVAKTHAPRWQGGPVGTVGRASIPTKSELQFLRQNRPDLLRPGSPIYNIVKSKLKTTFAGDPQALRELRRGDPSLFKPPKPMEKITVGASRVMLPSAQATQLAEIRKKREEEYHKQLQARQAAMKAAGMSITRQAPVLKAIGIFKLK